MRTRGLYFLLITAAMGQVLWAPTTAGAPSPVERMDSASSAAVAPRRGSTPNYISHYFTLAVFVVVTMLTGLIIVSPFGLTLKSIRDREVRSQTLGDYGT